jgi:hypothetical protein
VPPARWNRGFAVRRMPRSRGKSLDFRGYRSRTPKLARVEWEGEPSTCWRRVMVGQPSLCCVDAYHLPERAGRQAGYVGQQACWMIVRDQRVARLREAEMPKEVVWGSPWAALISA